MPWLWNLKSRSEVDHRRRDDEVTDVLAELRALVVELERQVDRIEQVAEKP